jgi:hypothetical protein
VRREESVVREKRLRPEFDVVFLLAPYSSLLTTK